MNNLASLLCTYAERECEGDLVLTLGDDRVTLTLQAGAIVHAALASDAQVTPLNALGPAAGGAPQSFSEATEALLAEAERQNAESHRRYDET